MLKFLNFLHLLIFSFYSFYELVINYDVLIPLFICISTDIGGYFFGKIFKGPKLTKISPNKTISGAVGSFIFSIFLVPIFYFSFNNFNNIFNLIFISFTISFFCQLGDLLVSYLKRRAKVKDTSNILPGHGGLLDRIDGMLLAIPIGIIIWKFLITTL